MTDLDPTLAELAGAYGIATEYWDWQGRHVAVPAATVVAVLAALDVDATSPDAAAAALSEHRLGRWRWVLPEFLAVRSGRTWAFDVHVPHGEAVRVWVELETGGVAEHLHQLENFSPPVEVDGRLVGEATFDLPADLPLGYHTLRAETGDAQASSPLVVTPAWLGLPEALGEHRTWGLATQLYSVCSEQSWGVGDLTDLTDLAVWAGVEHGADFVLVNPLHAAEPTAPMEPSPYLPTSRRFANPLYLRLERVPEYAYATDVQRRVVDAARAAARSGSGADRPEAARIDRDTAWTAKRAAARVLYEVPRSAGRELAFAGYRRREGAGLTDFATWCVLVETYGDRAEWPPELRHPAAPGVAEFAAAHEAQVTFYCWLQWLVDEQLAAAQSAARRAGMALGVVQDLAVGVHPRGADAWALQDTYATGITVGAPPDPYNQNGQDWSQPPWRPDRLAATAYAPFRAMVATALRHAGGLRVDHVLGLFRLWWIPDGAGPTEGTYVRYDHEALVGILALEAHRAGAVVVGEDLGTVEPWVRTHLRERGILGTSILWFEFAWDAGGAPLPPEQWRELCLASVTTHDLPPTAGYLAGDHVRLRDQLGVLTRPYAEELAADEAERRAWLDAVRDLGLLADDADVETQVAALHRFLTRTPARLRLLALTDAVGDRRVQNQPGTIDEYPNWRIPLSGPDGRPVPLEEVFSSPRAAALARVLRG